MQYEAWENEYKKLSLVTGKPEPQKDLLRFIKYLKKDLKKNVSGLNILDLGSGTGRNTNYLQKMGNNCVGIEISDTAISIANERAKTESLSTTFIKQSMGEKYPFEKNKFDIIIDFISSNSLNENERNTYLNEVGRVLKNDGYFFVKALCKDGDKNAAQLLQKSPGTEKDTYLIRELNLTERIFSKEYFIALYGKFFKIIKLEKKTSYTRFNNRSYKRNFWIAYLSK